MSYRCCYCQKPFTRAGSKRHHEKYTCWKRIENGHDKLPLVDLPSSTAITRVDAPKIAFPTEKQNGIPNGIERGIAFRFKTPSSILVVGPSGCGKTCFTESLLLDHLEELFVSPPPTIHYCYGVWQHGFQDMKDAGIQFHEGVPTTFHLQKWFPKGGLLVLDDLMFEGGEDKELLDLFTKHSHHQAFPTCWQDMMDVYQKVTERPFGYTVLDLHPASDDRKRVFSHLLTHEGYPRWHRRIKKEDV